MNNIQTVLFDLGGVLIELDGPPIRSEWIGEQITNEESWRRWGASAYVKAFETGKMTADDFIRGVMEEQKITLAEEAYRQCFIEWPKSLFEGVPDILLALRKNYKLAFYSNTCELHLPRLMNELKLADYFDNTFASYEIGHHKPDPAGYLYVIEQLQQPAETILFLDDNPNNVQSAASIGMRARQVVGVEQLKTVLQEEGVLH